MKAACHTDPPTSAAPARVCGPGKGCANQGTVAGRSERDVSGPAGTPWIRFTALGVLAAAAYIPIVGVLTAVVPSPFFARKLGVDGWNIASLVIPALMFGPLAATYLVPWPTSCRLGPRAGAGGALSFLAASCPLCNKLVILAVGTTGPVEYFRPLQPALGALSVVLLGTALRVRWRSRPSYAAAVHDAQNTRPAAIAREKL